MFRTMLPNEAAEHICPKMFNESGESACCQETRCMAWQWHDLEYEYVTTPAGYRPGKAYGWPLGWQKSIQRDGTQYWRRRRHFTERKGYCGAFNSDRRMNGEEPMNAKPVPMDDCELFEAAA